MLLVSVMSHGINGSLKGNDGATLPMNDFLHQFTQSVPEQVPIVGGFERSYINLFMVKNITENDWFFVFSNLHQEWTTFAMK